MPHQTSQKSLFVRFGEWIARCIYRVSSYGGENLPAGGFLLLPNHVTWIDAIVLQIACPRPIRFLVFEPIYRNPILNPIFRMVGAIPISPRNSKGAIQAAADRIRAGEVVCIFPEGELSRSGYLLRLKRGFELIARAAQAPVVPVWMDQLWGSIFSFYGGRFFRKIPRRVPYPVCIRFGTPIAPEEANVSLVRERLLELGELCYQQRPILKGHLAEASLRGLKHNQFRTAVIDGMDGSSLSAGMILAAGLTLASHLKKNCPNKRIAVVLPPGRGAVIANLGVMLAGKVPVNLNFTAGNAAVAASIRIAGIEDVVTAGPVLAKFRDLPLPENVLRLERLMPPLKKQVLLWRALIFLLPWQILARIANIPREGDRKEAVVLFTSGSAGEPKGVVLSHRNILANVTQFSVLLDLQKEDAILASLPFFHSFGCTVTLWYPLIEGVRMVTYSNPLEVNKNAELIERYKITLFLSTPTFLRGYLRKAEPEQLASIKLVVTGAEKLPMDLAEAFKARFGKEVLQGYGLTETSPVVSVNMPEPAAAEGESVQPSNRIGSVGKLATGIAAQIRDPDTGEELPLDHIGMLWLRGPNIFEGYLNEPKRTAEVIQDGWFKTGDLARFDEDGFLYIEGRLSRFSKIGGEMVPHETVEAKINEVLALANHERTIAVVGVPDEAKGEALVVLAACDIDPADLRAKLTEAGLPNLWIPKRIRRVEMIPALASGKLDLKGCKQVALE